VELTSYEITGMYLNYSWLEFNIRARIETLEMLVNERLLSCG
jgi:hypothetical protein